MSSGLPQVDLKDFADLRMGETIIAADCTGDGLPVYSADTKDAPWNFSSNCRTTNRHGCIVVGARGSIGNPRLPPFDEFAATQTTIVVDPWRSEFEPKFLLYALRQVDFSINTAQQAVPMLTIGDLRRVRVPKPDKSTQRRIATILTSLDEVIEATEKLVEKHQQIKAGLMHDLFTRGLWTRPELDRGDHHGLPCEATAQEGQLRPTPEDAPGLYQSSPLGLIPKAWKLSSIGSVAESLADGPFGSNLKTEHYVVEPGVRVVRLQNIQNTRYNDEDRAFVSQSHANYLIRNQVLPGDILVAGLGEDSHVVARACCYPKGLPPAINKADCFRLRCKHEEALNAFVMYYLNTSTARGQVRRFEQGVTRRRINGGNLKRVLLGLPLPAEQEQCVGILDSAGTDIDSINEQIAKLRQQKQGLMHDLLTGSVSAAAALDLHALTTESTPKP